MKNLPSIKCFPFLPKIILGVLSFFILNSSSFCGGWKSIGPTTGANSHIRSFAINAFTQKMYATTDSGLAQRDHDSVWSMLLGNGCTNYPIEPCNDYLDIWQHPMLDSVWFLGWRFSFFELPNTVLSRGGDPEAPWEKVIPSGGPPFHITVIFHPKAPAKLYANASGFCESNDTGRTWTCQNVGMFPGVDVIAIDEKLSEKIYAVGTIHRDSISGLYRTTDDGITWSYISSQGANLLLAYNDTLLTLSRKGIILSSDGGSSWNQVLVESISSLVRHPKHSNILFAGTSSGVIYRSTNGGGTWNLYNTTLPAFRITQLGFDGMSDTLYVGTGGGGIFQVYDVSVGVDEPSAEIPAEFKLFPAYPNPFNPSTTISFELPQRAEVRLEVFNVVGQKMATIFNGIKEAGRYSLPLNGHDWSSGVYHVRMIASGKVVTRSIVLTK